MTRSRPVPFQATDRRKDVLTGIDIWGRGTWGGGRFQSAAAAAAIAQAGLGVGLFAPAWTLESEAQVSSDCSTATADTDVCLGGDRAAAAAELRLIVRMPACGTAWCGRVQRDSRSYV